METVRNSRAAQLQRLTPSSIPAADTEEQRKFFLFNIRCHMMLLFSIALYAGPNRVRATLEGWRATIRAEVAAEKMYPINPAPHPQYGGRSLCSAQVHDNTIPAHYARILAQQQQAEEAERGQHVQKQLSSAASFLDIRAKGEMSTNADDVEYFLRRMANSAGGECDDYHISIKLLSKNEAMLTAEDKLVWARERFRADCAARAIRTYQEVSVTTHDGPIPKVRNTPIGPAGPIPPLDTKLLVTSKVLLSESVAAAAATATILLKQSPGPPRRRHRPAKETSEPNKVPCQAVPEWSMTMAPGVAGCSPGPLSPFQAPYTLDMQAQQDGMCVGERISELMRRNCPK